MELNSISKEVSTLRKYYRELVYVPVGSSGDKFRKKRTLDQNRFYWGAIIRPISDYLNCSPQETHEILKHMFLRESKEIWTGSVKSVLPHVGSTKSLNEREFNRYCEKIKKWVLREVLVQ